MIMPKAALTMKIIIMISALAIMPRRKEQKKSVMPTGEGSAGDK